MKGLFDIRSGERRNTFAAFGALLGITAGHTLMETARDALFLARMPASQLPWLYLVIVVVALALAKLGKTAGGKATVALALVLAAGVTSGFWALAASPTPALLYALYVWSGVFASWVTVQLWTLLGRIHTMTQAKRLYGFIGAGAVLGAVLGAVFARAMMAMLPPRASLLVAAGIFLAAAAPCLALVVPPAKEEPIATASAPEAAGGRLSTNLAILWDNAFARRVLGIVFVSTVTFTFADYLFKAQLASHVKDASELGATLATFYAIANAGSLVAQLVVAPWVFRTAGVQRALFFFPTALTAAAAGVVATAGSIGAVFALKGLDGVLRYSIHRTSTELLLVPVPDGTRERVKPIVDLVGSRGGQAAASLGILFLVAASAGRPRVLGAVVVTLGLVWLVLVLTIRTLYLDVFRETLRSGGLTGKAELPALDLGALETIFAGLNSPNDPEVLASLELLADQHRERLVPALILYHPSRAVVLRALEMFVQQERTDFVPIADRLDRHADRSVAAAALRARTTVLPDRALLEARLGSTCPEVAVTALTLLLSRGWIDQEAFDARIDATFAAGRWEPIAELGRAIAASPDPRFDDLLLRIVDEAPRFGAANSDQPSAEEVRVALVPARTEEAGEAPILVEAARAMGVRKDPRFLPVLVAMLRRAELRAVVRDALRAIPGALEALDLAFGAPQVPREVKLQIPRTMTLFEPAEAARLLARQLVHHEDGAVRYKILRALVKLRRQNADVAIDDAPLLRVVGSTLDHAAELRQWGRTLSAAEAAASPAHHLLADLVRDKETHAVQRTFLLLELLYREDFDDVWRGLRSADAKARASGLELVENIVKAPLRGRILALVGDERPAGAAMAYEAAIREILARGSSTMRALAEYRAHELGIDVSAVTRPSIEPSALATSLGALRDAGALLVTPRSHAPA